MNEITTAYYNLAVALFNQGQYEDAVCNFIKAYNMAESDGKEQILADLYNCFVFPNEEEFKKNYLANQFDEKTYPMDETVIDFIPVSDTMYYMFRNETGRFLDSICLEDQCPQTEGSELDGILIADIGDVRKILKYSRGLRNVYVLLEGVEGEFYSFLKLPDFTARYLQNMHIFHTLEDMKQYFTEHLDASLPVEIAARDAEKYKVVIWEIHQHRLADSGLKEHRPILSICIPSYNRGDKAQRAVENILESSLDSEIEIVISNNGSVINQEGYQNIKNMRDQRIQYSEFDSNQGYASNVAKVLSMARGRFAVLSSDEDIMHIENLRTFLKYILNYKDAGVIISSGTFRQLTDSCLEYGLDSLTMLIEYNYIAGIALNIDKLHRVHAFERFEAGRGNEFLEVYTHILFSLYAGIEEKVCCSEVLLFESEKEMNPAPADHPRILEYKLLENRIKQQNSAIELLRELFENDFMLFSMLTLNRMEKTYFLMSIVYKHNYELFTELHSWNEACLIMYENNKKLVDTYFRQTEGEKVWYTSIRDIMFTWLNDFPCRDSFPKEEIIKREIANKQAELRVLHGESIEDINIAALYEE